MEIVYVSKLVGKLGIWGLAALASALVAASFAGADAGGPGGPAAPAPRHGAERIADLCAPRATLGKSYTYSFDSEQQPAPVFSADPEDLPPGLKLGSDGVLHGVPT